MRSNGESLKIDALQASNWNREIFQDLVNAGMDAVHVTVSILAGLRRDFGSCWQMESLVRGK